ncbi:MAG TPA: hypothetical protein VI198_03170 [Candidatus Eisenbacteria bacterium]
MKRLFVVFALLLVTPAFAAESAKEHSKPIAGPPIFERLKGLVGEWQSTEKGMEQCTTSFELVANGSALMERLSPMAGVVMVNAYHPDGDAVVMTHYCATGNQPRMRCTKDGSSLAFAFSDITNWKKGESRMSGVTVTLVDADHMKQEWVSDEGEGKGTMTMEFARKK